MIFPLAHVPPPAPALVARPWAPRPAAATVVDTVEVTGPPVPVPSGTMAPTGVAETAPARPGWKMVWHDEFDGPQGALPDRSRWVMETGGGGWGNNELEYYTARPENAFLHDGSLVIEARREDYHGPDGVTRPYTSARLKTDTTFTQAYGRFEARIKVPQGQGLWPAFWMLGADIAKVGWPQCGEIDIMENVGFEPSTAHGTVHGPGYAGAESVGRPFTLPDGRRLADDFHEFAVEWAPQEIRFFVDDKLYHTVTPETLPAGRKWVYDHPFFLLLNVAVGGDWPKPPDATTRFPQQMQIDYVRVYARDEHQER